VEAAAGTVLVRPDGSFSSRRELGDLVVAVEGRLAGSEASGTVRVTLGGPGCDSAPVAWTARAG